MKGIRMGFWVVQLCLFTTIAQAGQLEVRWNELSPLVVGRDVTIVLPDGCSISGEVAAVREEALLMNITKTSDANGHPKGAASIPRSSIAEVEVKEMRSAAGRIFGTIVGLFLGMVVGGEIIAHTDVRDSPAVATFTGVTVASAVGGYYIGRSGDRRQKIIRIAN